MQFLDALSSLTSAFGVALLAGFAARFSYRLWPMFPLAAGIAAAGVIWTVIEINLLSPAAETQMLQAYAFDLGFKSFGWLMQLLVAVGFAIAGILLWELGLAILRGGINLKAVAVLVVVGGAVLLFFSLPHMSGGGKDSLAQVLGAALALGVMVAALLVGRGKKGG